MARSIVIEKRYPLPCGFAGMVLLVLITECVVSANWLTLSDPVSLSWRFSARAAASEASRCQIVCLGDSLIKHGVLPTVIAARTGCKTVNLSAARAPALWTYFVLRRALDAGAAPAAIVINAKPAVLMASPEFNGRYWQEVVTPREYLELSRTAADASFVLSTLVGRLLPSLRSRLELRSIASAAIRGETDPIPMINRVLWRNWTANDGANVTAAVANRLEETDAEIERRLHPSVFHVDRSNGQGLTELLNLANERAIPVFWLLPPVSHDLQARRDRSGAEALHEDFVRSFARKYPTSLTVLDGRACVPGQTAFADYTHLNGHGAIALSHAVATAIDARLHYRQPPSRDSHWVTLAVSGDQPFYPDVFVEDLEKSKQIVMQSQSPLISAR